MPVAQKIKTEHFYMVFLETHCGESLIIVSTKFTEKRIERTIVAV